MIWFYRDFLDGILYIVIALLSLIFIMAIIGFIMERLKLEKEEKNRMVVLQGDNLTPLENQVPSTSLENFQESPFELPTANASEGIPLEEASPFQEMGLNASTEQENQNTGVVNIDNMQEVVNIPTVTQVVEPVSPVVVPVSTPVVEDVNVSSVSSTDVNEVENQEVDVSNVSTVEPEFEIQLNDTAINPSNTKEETTRVQNEIETQTTEESIEAKKVAETDVGSKAVLPFVLPVVDINSNAEEVKESENNKEEIILTPAALDLSSSEVSVQSE